MDSRLVAPIDVSSSPLKASMLSGMSRMSTARLVAVTITTSSAWNAGGCGAGAVSGAAAGGSAGTVASTSWAETAEHPSASSPARIAERTRSGHLGGGLPRTPDPVANPLREVRQDLRAVGRQLV